MQPSNRREYGRSQVRIENAAGLFDEFDDGLMTAWMSHGDHVSVPAEGFRVDARSSDGVIAAVSDSSRHFYGVQFHPEVVHTPLGSDLLRNFLFNCAKIGDWTPASFVTRAIERIQAQVGEGKVICGLSGGVDSAVAASLIHAAIGDRLTCVFVDNGLLREGEAEQVVDVFSNRFGYDLRHIDASDEFLDALEGVTDPETKRKLLVEYFVEVFEREAKTIGGASFLAQGTLYPDVIESVSVRGPAAVIKSHHNVGGLPERMDLKSVNRCGNSSKMRRVKLDWS